MDDSRIPADCNAWANLPANLPGREETGLLLAAYASGAAGALPVATTVILVTGLYIDSPVRRRSSR